MSDPFKTTRWSLVLTAAAGTEGSREALEWLCATYWFPLYAFVRRQGHDPDAARDVTQSFFLRLLDRKALRRLDPQQGRFRAFLLASMKNFLANERARDAALKRRIEDPAFKVSLDDAESRYLGEPASRLGPEEIYETQWALAILDRSIGRLGDEQEATGRGELYRRLRGYLTGDDPPYDRLAADLQMTEGAVRVAVHRLRRRLGVLLREEVYHAGRAEDGRPYFAMEYVEGTWITRYCDACDMPVPGRLRLFMQVCGAIQHAHHKGVIHRDIKPSNILIQSEAGQAGPKVIDFGVAKAIGSHLTERTPVTRLGQSVGMPEYMSPEQAGPVPPAA